MRHRQARTAEEDEEEEEEPRLHGIAEAARGSRPVRRSVVPVFLLRKCIVVIAMWTVILAPVLELPAAAAAAARSLAFKSDGFKIVLFADLHYGENAWQDWGPAHDRNSTRVMSYLLDVEKPDIVIFLGDILTANNLVSPNATSYWEQAVSATKERKIPWASVFGNHDDTSFVWPLEWFGISGVPGASEIDQYFHGVTRAELMRNDKKNILSVSMEGPKVLWPSMSNFALEIASSDSLSTAVILYFLDSGGGSYPEVISARQAIWFEAVSSDLNPHAKIPEIVFWHIPSLAYVEVSPSPNLPIQSPCVGSINLESVAPQSAEFGIMDLLSRRSSVKAVFVGHNHGLDWCCPYKDLWLCFARHSGYGGYGNWTRGARVINLIEEPFELNTWIRLENGTVTSVTKLV